MLHTSLFFSNFIQPSPAPLLFLLPYFFELMGDRTTFDVLCFTSLHYGSKYVEDLAVCFMEQGVKFTDF